MSSILGVAQAHGCSSKFENSSKLENCFQIRRGALRAVAIATQQLRQWGEFAGIRRGVALAPGKVRAWEPGPLLQLHCCKYARQGPPAALEGSVAFALLQLLQCGQNCGNRGRYCIYPREGQRSGLPASAALTLLQQAAIRCPCGRCTGATAPVHHPEKSPRTASSREIQRTDSMMEAARHTHSETTGD